MKRILFYTSIKTRIKDQESLMDALIKQGHQVYFLNQQPNKYLPEIAKNLRVIYQTTPLQKSHFNAVRIVKQCWYLMRFIQQNKIEVVYSHLEPANFIAVLVQYVVRARIIIVRHHLDLAEHIGFHHDWSYRFTYSLSKEIICVSDAARKYMIEKEGVRQEKIHVIPLGYDYSVFGMPDDQQLEALKNKHRGQLVLLTVGRLDNLKRPAYAVQICSALRKHGVNVVLYLLGEGDRAEIEKFIQELQLEDAVICLGYSDNVLDYMAAADWLLHPSVSESSCVVVKEAAWVKLPVIVCQGVGDFDDYLVHKQNALLLDKESFIDEAVNAILDYQSDSLTRNQLGKQLYQTVIPRFDIQSIISHYDIFHSSN
ncbi:MAG: glycosyltransferase family 4 protein [Cyclobacteriaceae bacterium]|nr:glycosyltransferase family 4 protein [Cyclobacteriaceae bacterium]